MKKIYILLVFTLISSISFAQEVKKDSTKALDELVVKEKRKTAKERGEFKRHAQTVEAMPEEELNRNNPAFIEQSLGTMAGVQVDKRTQLGGQRIVIRGYGNDQKFNNWGVKAYLNGVPLTTADGVTVLDDIDFANVNNIEVIKGPAATMYGGGVGGVARFYMKSSEDKGVSITEKAAFGSFGLFQANTRVDFVGENSGLALTYGHIESDGYRPRGNSLKNYWSLFGEFKLDKKQSFTAYMSHNFSHENVTGQISYADYYAGIDNGNAAYAKKNARNDLQTDRISLTYGYKFNTHFSNRTSFFYFNQDQHNVSAAADGNSFNPNYGLRSVFNLKTNLSPNLTYDLDLGTEIQQSRSLATSFRFLGTDDANPLKLQDISKGSYFKTTTNQSSIFAINRIGINPLDLTLILGLSINDLNYERVDLLAGQGLFTVAAYGKDLSFGKSFETSLNPHIALQKNFGLQILNISYSEGFNAPTASTAFISTINKANDGLLPEKGRMFDVGLQGLLFNNKLDYQLSVFTIGIANKLTQLSGVIPTGGTYTYFANTGNQRNNGFEASVGYLILPNEGKGFIRKIEPFFNLSSYDFKYSDFKTKFGADVVDFSSKQVVGVPKTKFTLGLDIQTNVGFYMNNTFNSMGDVYTDFANTNNVKGYSLLNSKIGYRMTSKKVDFDVYFAGNNLTNQINYTFLFLGNNINDADPGNGYPANVTTDVNPGPSKAYYFGGVNVKFKF